MITQDGESNRDLLLSVTDRKALAPGGHSCVITQDGESSRDLLLSVTDRKALAPGGHSPPEPPLQNIYYITTSHFLTTRPAVGCWLRKKVSTLIGYLLTDGLNCLTVKYLAGWHLE